MLKFFASVRWRLVMGLLGVLLVASTLAVAQTRIVRTEATRATPGSPAMRDLSATPMPPDATVSMHWPDVLEAWGFPSDAMALRHHLAGVWVRQLQGQVAVPAPTVGEGVEEGRLAMARQPQPATPEVWRQVVQRSLRFQRAERSPPIPGEIESLSVQLEEVLPGVWLHHQADGRVRGVFMWGWLTSQVTVPLTLGPFDLVALPQATGVPPRWHCELPRGASPLALMPGTSQAWLCRSATAGPWPAGHPRAEDLLAGEVAREWRVEALDFDRPQAYASLVTTLGWRNQDQAQAFLRRHGSCEQLGRCVGVSVSSQDARVAGVPAPRLEQAHGSAALRRLAERALPWLMLLGAFLVYALVAHALSNRMAAVLLWVGSMAWAVVLVRQLWGMNWADSWGGLLVIPATGMLLVGPFVVTGLAYGGYELCVDPEARRNASRAFWGAMLLLAGVLLVRLVSVLTGLD
jgi:hypothetical protein